MSRIGHPLVGTFISLVPCLLLSLAIPVVSRAQHAGGPLNLQRFHPSMDSMGLVSLNASQVLRHLEPSLGMVLSWTQRPLDLRGRTQGGEPSRFTVEHLFTSNLQLGLGLWDHLELGLDLPLSFWEGKALPDGDSSFGRQGVSDLSCHLKGRILDTSRSPVGLALHLALSMPTGNAEMLLGSSTASLAPALILDRGWLDHRVLVLLNLGARFQLGGQGRWTDTRPCEQQADCGTRRQIDTGHEVRGGVGASLAVTPGRLHLLAELSAWGDLNRQTISDQPRVAAVLMGGLRLYLAGRSYLSLALGRGLRGSDSNFRHGSPDLRASIGFTFEPAIGDQDRDGIKDDRDRCPLDAEDRDDFEDADGCPDSDNDRDGILDRDDRCANEPEDRDGHQDTDGCPEPDLLDRDGDGIPDAQDRCADDPEDRDGFEDDDGCPDPDNDHDRILDSDDLCPDQPEDVDAFEDADGCPDRDNDRDGILDREDRCPDEPETKNSYLDDDGCPDRRPFSAHRWRIDLLKEIHFETDSAIIRPDSYPILDAIAAYLNDTPEILLVEVQGHADERGSWAHNMRLTADRAFAVKGYLVRRGVGANRLQAKGYGEARPVDRGHSPRAWSKNRRVEVMILKRSH